MATQVHSFKTTFNKNGNITITFYEGTKRRDIKLVKDTAACITYEVLFYSESDNTQAPNEEVTGHALAWLRREFKFKKHPNNPSLFYPKSRA